MQQSLLPSVPRAKSISRRLLSLRGYPNKVVSLLLGAYADVNAQDKQQRTPLHLCSELGHQAVVEVREYCLLRARAGRANIYLHSTVEPTVESDEKERNRDAFAGKARCRGTRCLLLERV